MIARDLKVITSNKTKELRKPASLCFWTGSCRRHHARMIGQDAEHKSAYIPQTMPVSDEPWSRQGFVGMRR